LVDSHPGASAATTAASAGADAMFVFNPLWQLGQRSQTHEMLEAARAPRIPVFFPEPEPVDLGGLMSCGPDFVDEVRRAADQVARILKGAKPGELAVDQATRFEMVVNRRTETELGITLPQSILLRADRVIE
jgi:putative ABC transport system substrate-binding protein